MSLSDTRERAAAPFSEVHAWKPVQKGWHHLHGSFGEFGFSIEWHDFQSPEDLDWSGSFHPDAVEICLNLSGRGEIHAGSQELRFSPTTSGFYFQGPARLKGVRAGGERHQFMTIEFSRDFLKRHLIWREDGLDPSLRGLFGRRDRASVSGSTRLSSEQQELIFALRNPPANTASRRMWSYAKALEVAASVFYAPMEGKELFCERVKRVNRERVQKVMALLSENLAEAPSLEEIGRRVGCSHFHLCRIFSEQMGCGIYQYLRQLRLERAAALLSEGRMKITQIALEVGYSSPSHFTTAFREAFGCCPGLFPLKSGLERPRNQTAGR